MVLLLLIALLLVVWWCRRRGSWKFGADLFVDSVPMSSATADQEWLDRYEVSERNPYIESVATGPEFTSIPLWQAKMTCWYNKDCIGFQRRNVATAADNEELPTRFLGEGAQAGGGYIYRKSNSVQSGTRRGPTFVVKARGRCLDVSGDPERGKLPGSLRGQFGNSSYTRDYNSQWNPLLYYNAHCHGGTNQQFFFNDSKITSVSEGTNIGAMGTWEADYNLIDTFGIDKTALPYHEVGLSSNDLFTAIPLEDQPSYYGIYRSDGKRLTGIRAGTEISGLYETGPAIDGSSGVQGKAHATTHKEAWFRPAIMNDFDAYSFVEDKYSEFHNPQLLAPEASKSGGPYDGCDSFYTKRAGICYENCFPDEDSDGTYGCYKKPPADWKGGTTITHLQHQYSPAVAMVGTCPEGYYLSGAICYDDRTRDGPLSYT